MTTEAAQTPAEAHSRLAMVGTAVVMLCFQIVILWAIFRVITGSVFWRRAFKYFFVLLAAFFAVAFVLASVQP